MFDTPADLRSVQSKRQWIGKINLVQVRVWVAAGSRSQDPSVKCVWSVCQQRACCPLPFLAVTSGRLCSLARSTQGVLSCGSEGSSQHLLTHPPESGRGSLFRKRTLHGLQPTGLLCSWGFSRQEYWSGLPWTPTKQRALLYNLSNSIPRRDIFTGSLWSQILFLLPEHATRYSILKIL